MSAIKVFSSSPQLAKFHQVSLEDKEIIKNVLEGDVDQYRLLVERHMKTVMSIVSKRVRASEAQEVAHDVFVRAYNSLNKYRADSPFVHWLSKIAVRECYDFWRKKYKSHPNENVRSDNDISIDEFKKDEDKKEALELINFALSKLSPENRAVITLVHLEGYSVAEAAEMLGWTMVNVKVRAHRAREQLKDILDKVMV